MGFSWSRPALIVAPIEDESICNEPISPIVSKTVTFVDATPSSPGRLGTPPRVRPTPLKRNMALYVRPATCLEPTIEDYTRLVRTWRLNCIISHDRK